MDGLKKVCGKVRFDGVIEGSSGTANNIGSNEMVEIDLAITRSFIYLTRNNSICTCH